MLSSRKRPQFKVSSYLIYLACWVVCQKMHVSYPVVLDLTMVRGMCCTVSPWEKNEKKLTVLYWFGAKTRKVKILWQNTHKKKGCAFRDRSIGNQVLPVLHLICLYLNQVLCVTGINSPIQSASEILQKIFWVIYVQKDADMKVANIFSGKVRLNMFAMQTMLRL